MIPDGYNPRKAAQVIAYFIMKGANECLPVLKAVKLVYLADRESMSRFGFPILDDQAVSMQHGPVPSATLSYINGEVDTEECGWSDFLMARENHNVSLVKSISEDDLDELSEADFICLDEVWKIFGSMGRFEIRDWTHNPQNIPEWEDPGRSSRTIPIERILRTLQVPNSDELAEQIKEFRLVEQTLSRFRDQ